MYSLLHSKNLFYWFITFFHSFKSTLASSIHSVYCLVLMTLLVCKDIITTKLFMYHYVHIHITIKVMLILSMHLLLMKTTFIICFIIHWDLLWMPNNNTAVTLNDTTDSSYNGFLFYRLLSQ